MIEVQTGAVTTLGEHKIKTALCEFTGDGNYLVSGGWDREIICWDLRTSQRAFTFAGTGYVHLWNADRRRCVVLLPPGVLQFFVFERPGHRELLGHPGEALDRGEFSPDGRWLVARDGRRACVWDGTGGAPARILPTPVPNNMTAAFSPDSEELLLTLPDDSPSRASLERWRLARGTDARTPPRIESLPVKFPQGITRAVVVSNQVVMTSTESVHVVARTNVASGQGRVAPIPPGTGCVAPDGRWLAMVYGWSPTVGIYRLPEVAELARLETGNFVMFVAFSPSADELLVINRNGTEWFDTTTWQRTRQQAGAPVSGSYAFYTPDGRGVWMVTHFRNASLLDRRTLDPILPLPNDVLPLALSPDGRHLAASVEGRRVELWDFGALRRELANLGLGWD